MASNFPSSLDTFTNPSSSDAMDSVSVPHASQHSDLNDAVEALQAKVGADSSAVTSSHDYKIAQLESAATGKILQVVQATYSTAEATTSSSYVDTSLEATITPSSATSKVFVLCNGGSNSSRVGSSTGKGEHAIERGGSQIYECATTLYTDSSSGVATRSLAVSFTLSYLDSPATTSATTYTLQHKTSVGTLTTFPDNYAGSLILMEVSA